MDTHPSWLLYRPDLYRGVTARKLLFSALLVAVAITALCGIYVLFDLQAVLPARPL